LRPRSCGSVASTNRKSGLSARTGGRRH